MWIGDHSQQIDVEDKEADSKVRVPIGIEAIRPRVVPAAGVDTIQTAREVAANPAFQTAF